MGRIIKHILADILRNKIMIAYLIFLLVASLSVFNLQDTAVKGLVSMLNIIIFIVPLFSMVFATIYLYNSAEFIELLVSQPVRRTTIWSGLFVGLSVALVGSVIVGFGIPMLLYAMTAGGITILLSGIFLTLIFTAISMLVVVSTRDKARGVGKIIMLWLFFSLIFDALVLLLIFQLADYPIEQPMILISFLNPIDMARIMALLQLDISALMGMTGAIFRDFFGSTLGIFIAIAAMLLWIAVPYLLSRAKFSRKDL